MTARSTGQAEPDSLAAVQAILTALTPFDEATRQRIIASAAALVGAHPVSTVPPIQGHAEGAKALGVPKQGGRPLSPVELIQQKLPATNAQRLALFAYYREHHEGQARFSREDLKPYFAKAKEPPPKNYDRDFKAAITQGWIYEDGEESYLTSKGLEAVEAGFAGKGQPRGASSPKYKKKRVTKKSRRR